MQDDYSGKKIKIIQDHFDKMVGLQEGRKAILNLIVEKHQIYVINYTNDDDSNKCQASLSLQSKSQLIKTIADYAQMNEKSQLISIILQPSIFKLIQYFEVIKLQQINTVINKFLCIGFKFNELIDPLQKQIQIQLLGYVFGQNGRVSKSMNQNRIFKVKDQENIILNALKLHKEQKNKIDAQLFEKLNNLLPIYSYQIEFLTRVVSLKKNIISDKEYSKDQVSNPYHFLFHFNFQDNPRQIATSLSNYVKSLFESIDKKQNIDQFDLRKPCFYPTKLANPHLFLKTLSKPKHQLFLTKGCYEYFHYGDQNFNDQGWGCAYRSLQTVLSWLNLQSYINIKIPTIANIQSTLDIINSTGSKLANTQTWIGATQVSWFIKHVSGLDSRILHIAQGSAISEYLESFREHLEKTGCPIMFGGGQYAYCVVGMNYCWKLGEVQFLILDPHYNGNDSIDKIIERKGVCWRKPEEMFKKGIFYNFCMPIIP